MKRYLLFAFLAMMQVAAWAVIVNNGDKFKYTHGGKTLWYTITDASRGYVKVGRTVTDGSLQTSNAGATTSDVSGDVTIPSTVTWNGVNFTVKEIGEFSFGRASGTSSLTNVYMPSTVTKISGYAFQNCTSLASISLPGSVTSIGERAFYGCSILYFVFADMTSPCTFGTNAFYGIGSSCYLRVPSGKKSDYINKGWTTSIFKGGVLDGTVGDTFKYTYEGKAMWYKVTDVTNKCVQVGDGSNAAISTSTTGTVSIPSSVAVPAIGSNYKVTSIGTQAFYNCTSLTSVSIPSGVTSIGYAAFMDCSGLTGITLPNTIRTIGSNAFNSCSGLTSITLPSSVTSIGSYAFALCSQLGRVTANMTSPIAFGTGAFNKIGSTCCLRVPSGKKADYINNGWTTSIFKGGVYDGTVDETFTYTYGGKTLTYKITDATKGYVQVGNGSNTAISTSAVGAVNIPSSVTHPALKTNYEVKKIGYYAFYTCKSLTSVTIPSSVTSIGEYAFRDCSGLTSVTIPSSVTYIAAQAFLRCSGLTTLTLPNSVTYIGSSAFKGCSGLTSVTANMTNPFTFKTDAFNSIGSTCWLKVPAGKRLAYIAAGWTEDVFQGGVYDGTEDTFKYTYNGKTLTYKITDTTNLYVQVGDGNNAAISTSATGSVTIPSSVTHLEKTYTVKGIGNSAFQDCSSLTSVTIPNSVTYIESYAFYYCSGLTSITIPENVTEIGYRAFLGCSGLTNISVAVGNTVYDSRDNCNAIILTASNSLVVGCQNTVIPTSVTSIEWDAFNGCNGLKKLTIPAGVTYIGGLAFANCSGLESITAESTTPCYFAADYDLYPYKINDHCKLYVPYGMKDAYIAKGWTEDIFKGGIYENDTFYYEYESRKLLYKITDKKNRYVQVGGGYVGESEDGTYIYNTAISTSAKGSVFIPATVTYEGETYTVTEVGDGAFYGCTGLTSVTVPEGVRACGVYAFMGCSSLKTVTLPNSMVSLQAAVFEGCSSLRSIELPDNLREMRLEVFAGCTSLTSIDIPDGVTRIEYNAFSGCTSLVTVNLPDNLTSIEDDAFRNCSSLTSVYANMATPCTIGFFEFLSINKDCKLYVPFGKKDAYIAAGWTEDVFKGGVFEIGSAAVTGDVDGSGTPDISDVTTLVNIILGK